MDCEVAVAMQAGVGRGCCWWWFLLVVVSVRRTGPLHRLTQAKALLEGGRLALAIVK